MTFYIEQNGKPIGPISIEDVQKYNIKKDTLIWEEGSPNWIKAEDSHFIKPFISIAPPPLPNIKDLERSQRYDLSVPKEKDLILTGFLLIIIWLIVSIVGYYNLPLQQDFQSINSEVDNITPIVITMFAIAFRLFAISKALPVAKKLNRDPISWAIFAFFLPGISLIVLGTKYKLYDYFEN